MPPRCFFAENILGKSRLHALCQMDFDARCQIPVIHEQQTDFLLILPNFALFYYANAKCKNNLQHRLQVGLRCFILVVENKTTAAYNQAKERSWYDGFAAGIVIRPSLGYAVRREDFPASGFHAAAGKFFIFSRR